MIGNTERIAEIQNKLQKWKWEGVCILTVRNRKHFPCFYTVTETRVEFNNESLLTLIVSTSGAGCANVTLCWDKANLLSLIDKFSDLKTLNINEKTNIYRHSWKQHVKISITAKFKEEIL